MVMNSSETPEMESAVCGKSLHFIGIGGISMSSLAMISKKRGATVTGSDSVCSPMTERVERSGITVFYGHKPENIPDRCDEIIFTAAVHEDNHEILEARRRGIKCSTRAEFFGRLMLRYEKRIGVAGTHGKSTTTSMISGIMMDSSEDPTVVCGAELTRLGGAFRIGNGDSIVFEACEYTDSFLKFSPSTAVVLNIELEHVDYFRNLEQITESFRSYISCASIAVVNGESETVKKAIYGFDGRIITFGTHCDYPSFLPDTHYYPLNIKLRPGGSEYTLMRMRRGEQPEDVAHISLCVPGMHNILDSVASAAACLENGCSPEGVATGLRSFTGARRRMELRGKAVSGADVYDDYAHHPTEIKAALEAAHSYGKRIWCVFQPHTFSRTAGLFDTLSVSFGDADRLIITDIYSAGREKNTSGITSEKLAGAIPGAVYMPKGENFGEIRSYLEAGTGENDLILVMGAGDIIKLSNSLTSLPQK